MNTLLALMVSAAVLVSIPGPNLALIAANSLKFGFRSGLVTVLGAADARPLHELAQSPGWRIPHGVRLALSRR